MIKILADAGTSWTKTLEIFDDSDQISSSPIEIILKENSISSNASEIKDKDGNVSCARYSLIPTKIINRFESVLFDAATGHMSSRRIKPEGKYENELVAMALGGMKIIDNANVTLVDLGSRDSKWIKYIDYKYKDLDWNGTCGSGTGATIEMVTNFFDIEFDKLPVEKDKIAVTCGVFGMEKIMDQVAKGIPPEVAISRYIHGIAFNVWNFAHCPEILYLSGGLCLNSCFVNSLRQYCDVVVLGRYVLVEGLY